MDNSHSPSDWLQELLEYIQNFKYQSRFLRVGMKPPSNMLPFEKIRYASQAFLAGALPSAETLEYIAVSFEKYISREGEISLDEAFELRSTPSQGNPSRKYAHDNFLNNVLFEMSYLRAQNKMTKKRMSLEKVADAVIPPEFTYSIDTLVSYYKKRKWDVVRDMLVKQGNIKEGKLIL